ncbi:MAG: c-type cytochrome biogenesis protein CcmI, partial [Proteobacteria bacterium]|nr:c-type cytochrome biogenesis protein CcmI [Pseudomonadota bacterium]
MTGLWIAAAVMTVAVLAAVLMPLLRRSPAPPPARREFDLNVYKDQLGEIDRDLERGLLDDADAEAARVEIQRRMLTAADQDGGGDGGGAASRQPGNRALAAALAVLLPAGAFGIYFVLGSPDLPDRPFAERNIGEEIIAREGRLERNEVLQMAARLLKRLEKAPGDADGWVLLGRTYLTIDEFDDAIGAYRRAMEASGRRPEIAADYAEALMLANEGRIGAEVRGLFEDIAKARPLNLKARYYLGLDMAQQGNLKGALQAWVDLTALSPAGAPWRRGVAQ